ncbi:hypothetical protein X777_08501, partial [Ooceraea biroi]
SLSLFGDSNIKTIDSGLSHALRVTVSSAPAHRRIFDILKTIRRDYHALVKL